MITRWEPGRDVVDGLLSQQHLQAVPANRDYADTLIEQAGRHLRTAGATVGSDPEGSAAMLYDAARKALVAVLANQGLRATGRGGHLAAYDAVIAQLDPPLGSVLRPFDRLRRQRNRVEYPPVDQPAPVLEADDLEADIARARAIVEVCARVLDQMPVYGAR